MPQTRKAFDRRVQLLAAQENLSHPEVGLRLAGIDLDLLAVVVERVVQPAAGGVQTR